MERDAGHEVVPQRQDRIERVGETLIERAEIELLGLGAVRRDQLRGLDDGHNKTVATGWDTEQRPGRGLAGRRPSKEPDSRTVRAGSSAPKR